MLLELLKSPASSLNIQLSQLQALLAEIFGAGQLTANPGQSSTFPVGLTSTGTVPMFAGVDIVSLNSLAGATPALKSFAIPAGALSTTGFRGLRVRGSGSFANNANAKTVLLKFGGTTVATVTATASVANTWMIEGTVWVRTATTQICQAFGTNSPGTPTFVSTNVTAAETLSGAITLAFTGTQTSAADIVQDEMIVELIP